MHEEDSKTKPESYSGSILGFGEQLADDGNKRLFIAKGEFMPNQILSHVHGYGFLTKVHLCKSLTRSSSVCVYAFGGTGCNETERAWTLIQPTAFDVEIKEFTKLCKP